MTGPGRMLCTTCYGDLGDARFDGSVGAWVYECDTCPGVDGPLTLEVPGEPPRAADAGDGADIVAELGVHAGLRTALGRIPGRWLEFGVVEHLYARTDPDAYQVLVERYGHGAVTPGARNTASWMLGRVLWSLKRANEVLVKGMPHGTGRWEYLAPCHAWALPGLTGHATLVTWEALAEQEAFRPDRHPALERGDAPDAGPLATEPPPDAHLIGP